MSKAKILFVKMFMVVFRSIVRSYTFLTLPIYYWIQKPYKTLAKSQFQRSKQLDPNDSYSPYVRTTETKFHVLTTARSIAETFQICRKINPSDRQAIGFRKIVEEQVQTDLKGNVVRMDGKVLRKYRLSPYVWMTYGQVFDRVDCISRGLVANGFKRGEKIVVLAETCADNLIFLQVCVNIGAVYSTVFSTLGDEGIIHCINETNASIVYTTYDLLEKVLDLCRKCQNVSTILYVDSNARNNNNQVLNLSSNMRLISMSELYSEGQKCQIDLDGMQLEPDEVHVVSYRESLTNEQMSMHNAKKLTNRRPLTYPFQR